MNNQKGTSHSLLLIIISYVAFISLGLPDGLLGIAWPFLSERHSVPLDSLGILLISFVAGYLATSTTSGKIVTIIPLGVLLALSSSITGLSLLGYAFSNYWFLVVVASFFLGSGGGAIDASINIFAASRFSASTINWLHGFYGLGATTGPIIMTYIFIHGQQWYYGYILVGGVQIALSVIFLSTMKYWKVSGDHEEHTSPSSIGETFRVPLVWISILIFFFIYRIGDWCRTMDIYYPYKVQKH